MIRHTISHDHHYIPQCYLKGFCRTDGTFDVYDKRYKQFRKAPQTPATAFYEKQRNTIKFRGQRTDKIEKLYSGLESGIANLFALIRNGMSSSQLLNVEGIYLLKLHIAIQFWRLPRFDEFADQYLLSRTPTQLEQLCSVCKPQILPAHDVFELIQADAGFRHYFRSFWLPLGTFELNKPISENMEWLILDMENPSEWSNHLCCDAPFIFEHPNDLLHFSGQFIFPLTNSRLLVSRHRTNKAPSFEPILSTKISILLYLQAKQYVATSNRSYLEKIIEFSEIYIGTDGIKRLQNEVLGYLK